MTARVEPPAEHRGVRWHWLRHETAGLIPAAWEDSRWRPWDWTGSLGSTDISGWGYRYLGPAIPPEEPRDGE